MHRSDDPIGISTNRRATKPDYTLRHAEHGRRRKGLRGPLFALLHLLMFLAAAPAWAAPQTLFTTQIPVVEDATDGVPYELGMQFQSYVAGSVTAIRHWRAPSDNAVHVGKLWNAAGKELASVEFTNETSSGWQQQALEEPVSIQAGQSYVVSVNVGSHFPITQNAFPVTNGNLTGSDGVFNTTPGSVPTTPTGSNYFRDVVFESGVNLSVNLPTMPVTADHGAWLSNGSPDSAYDVILSDVGSGFDVTNSPPTYAGWCIEANTRPNVPLPGPNVTLYSSYDPFLATLEPAGGYELLLNNAPKLNYILNNPQGNKYDVQAAIFLLFYGELGANFPTGGLTNGSLATAQAMVDAANTLGASFVPGVGDNIAILMYTADGQPLSTKIVGYQDSVIVIPVPPPPVKAKLGDRLWEDLDADGVQDCEDTNGNGILGDVVPGQEGNPAVSDQGPECGAGVPGAQVTLLGSDCSTPVSGVNLAVSDAQGFYLFEDLAPGDYCVAFSPPADFCGGFGGPEFTTPKVGSDPAKDSDADPATGLAAGISLASGQTDRTWDAGIYCSARLGDRVWNDLNSDGIQDCDSDDAIVGTANDVGDECAAAGVSGVPVRLYRGDENGQCDRSQVLATQVTSTLPQDGTSPGFYFFTQLDDGTPLPPGYYCVEWTPPAGFTCTTPTTDETPESRVDSDGVLATLPDGTEVCRTVEPVFVASRSARRVWDLGLVEKPSPACEVAVDKKCLVTLPPSGDLACSDKIVATTLRYTGPSISSATVEVDPDKGDTVVYNNIELVSGITVLAAQSQGGFTVDARASNENELGSKTRIRINGIEEVLHTSCSTPYVAGQPAPLDNPKGDPSANWFVVNFVDKDALNTIVQVPEPPQAQDNCVATLPPPVSCETVGKPTELVFQYTAGGCSATSNPQDGKAECTPSGTLDGPVTVRAAGNNSLTKDVYTVTGSPVAEGGTFTISFNGADLKSDSYVELTDSDGDTEVNKIHTSCSKDLAVGDVFGSLTLVGFNGAFNNVEVTYTFDVTNLGSSALSDLVVEDSIFGQLDAGLNLAPAGQAGDSASYTETAFLSATEINTVTVKDGAQLCGQDTATVTVNPPAIPIAGRCDELKPIDALVLEYLDQGRGDITKVDLYDGKFDPNNPAKDLFKTVEGTITNGDVVTFDGYAAVGAPNDVDIRMTFTDGATATSQFHRSCSDNEMNDIADCGTLQGNGKDNNSGLNTWLLQDLLGEGKRLGCPDSPYAQ